MHPLHATLLGAVEGVTEFLPISSTGHLILVSRLLGLQGSAVNTFDVIIQAGALGAVIVLYRARIASMWSGLIGRDAAGRRLLTNLVISFLPAAILGVALHHTIKLRLFTVWPVVAALALGGLLMIGVDRWWARPASSKRLESVTRREAFFIGCAQCLSLWPGTSRSMVTIVAALLLGYPATAAAEYSFLLALPTLGAATLFDAATDGTALLRAVSWVSVGCGFFAAALVAALAIRTFLQYLTRRGLAPFGWYRVGLAAVVWLTIPRI